MKKRLHLTIATFLTLSLLTLQPCKAEDGVIYGCYQKEHGQLRIVNDCNECLNSEIPIALNQAMGTPTVKLAVVTAILKFREAEEGSLIEGGTLIIANQQNIDLDSDWQSVFEIINEELDEDGDEVADDRRWGLRCREENGWVNTSCSQNTDSEKIIAPFDVDLPQYLNGCYSDDEEYNYMSLFCTCSKIIVVGNQ